MPTGDEDHNPFSAPTFSGASAESVDSDAFVWDWKKHECPPACVLTNSTDNIDRYRVSAMGKSAILIAVFLGVPFIGWLLVLLCSQFLISRGSVVELEVWIRRRYRLYNKILESLVVTGMIVGNLLTGLSLTFEGVNTMFAGILCHVVGILLACLPTPAGWMLGYDLQADGRVSLTGLHPAHPLRNAVQDP